MTAVVPAPVPAPASLGGPALVSRGLTKRFGRILALDGLDLDVPRGSIFGLLGPNGAGKTTTIRILTGLARPTSGTARVDGIEVGLDQPELRRRIGYLDQDPRFYGWMTGRELLELVGRLHGLVGRELRERVAGTLERTGLAGAGERRIGGYSGGMRQRLGIAQAILNRPSLLFLDEPVSSLDPEGRRDLLELIEALRGEVTVVFSTHLLADVERICDRIAILDRGRLVIDCPLDVLLSSHAGPVFRLESGPDQEESVGRLVERLQIASWAADVTTWSRPGNRQVVNVSVTDQSLASREILPLVVDAGLVLAAFEQVRPTLEEVFLRLVGPPHPDELDGRGFVRPREVPPE